MALLFTSFYKGNKGSVAVSGALSAQDISHSHSLDNTILTQVQILVSADIAHSHTLDTSALIIQGNLVTEDVAHNNTVDAATLTQASTLTVNDISHSHTLDASTVSITHSLTANDISHTNTLDASTVTEDGGYTGPYTYQDTSTYLPGFAENNHTHNVTIGTATTDREVVVALSWSATTNRTISDVTVGGVSLTQRANAGSLRDNSEIWSGTVSSASVAGTTADVVIAASGLFGGSRVDIYSANGPSTTTPSDTDFNLETSVTSSSASLTVGGNDFVVAASTINGTGDATFTAGVTDDATSTQIGTVRYGVGGSDGYASGQSVTVTAQRVAGGTANSIAVATASFPA